MPRRYLEVRPVLAGNSVEEYPDYPDSDVLVVRAGRTLGVQGPDIVATSEITLGDGNYFNILAGSNILRMCGVGWTPGSVATLHFPESFGIYIIHGASSYGDYLGFQLSGSLDFVAGFNSLLTLMLVETYVERRWYELSRVVI